MTKKSILMPALALTILAICPANSQDDTAGKAIKILVDRCVECHGPDKQKGKLRLDSRDAALHVVKPGKVDESELFTRITLPADDVDIMPPKGDPLTPEQVAVIRKWIESGAEWAKPAANPEASTEEAPKETISNVLNKLSPQELELLRKWIQDGGKLPESVSGEKPSAAEVKLQPFPESEAEKKAVASLQESGALAMKVSQEGNWLRVNCRLVGERIGDKEITPLADMKNLIELDLSRTQVTDDGLKAIAGITNLTHLNLNNTGISDAGLIHVAGLGNLTYLNLYGSKVTDAGLTHLKDLKALKKLYIWQTEITEAGKEALRKDLPAVEIIGGWKLENVETPKSEPEAKQAAETSGDSKKNDTAQAAESKPKTLTLAEILLNF